jgi:hypothetical protein
MHMKKNVGTLDKSIRLAGAAIAAALYFTDIVSGTPGLIVLAAGVVLALTSIVGFCPLYTVLGLNTCPARKP